MNPLEHVSRRGAGWWLLICLLCLCGSSIAQSDKTALSDVPLDFKGIPLGSSDDALRQKFPELRCNVPMQKAQTESMRSIKEYWERKATEADLVCQRAFADPEPPWPLRDFAGHKAGSVSFVYLAGKLMMAEATLPAFAFRDIVEGLTQKYGPPSTSATEILQNRMGATFQNEIVTWRRHNGEIRVSKYDRDLETARYGLTADEYIAEMNRRRANRVKGGAKNL